MNPRDFEQNIGFAVIREQIGALALSEKGREGVMMSQFRSDKVYVSSVQHRLSEFKKILMLDARFRAAGYGDESDALRRLGYPDQSLLLEELHRIGQALTALTAIQQYFEARDGYPALGALASSVPSFAMQREAIVRIVTPSGGLRDDASPRLQQLRSQISAREENIARRLSAILSSAQREGMSPDGASPTLRGGRPVIPILATYRKRFAAVVQDRSSTGQTLYVEPYEVIEIQNDIDDLRQAEQEEIVRLLKELSNVLRPDAPTLIEAMQILTQFDVLRAKALFAVRVGGSMPILVDTPTLYVRLR